MTTPDENSLSRSDRIALAAAYVVSIIGLFALGAGSVLGILIAGGTALASPSKPVLRHAGRIAALDGAVLLCGLVIGAVLRSWIFVRMPSGEEFVWGLAGLALSGAVVIGVKVALFVSMTRLANGRL